MAKAKYVQKSHFLDTRIQDLIAKIEHEGIPPTFGTEKCAEILGCSTQWIEIGRSRGYGPPYTKVTNHMSATRGPACWNGSLSEQFIAANY